MIEAEDDSKKGNLSAQKFEKGVISLQQDKNDKIQPTKEQLDKLALRASRGNMEAYGKLVEYYKEYMYKTAFLMMNNSEQALDIVGETILKGARFADKIKKPQYFKTWLTKILINVAKDYYRKYPDEEDIDQIQIPEEESPISIEEKIDLNHAVNLLPDRFRTVIILKYFDEMKISEIAYIMGIPEGSVKAYLYRAKEELRKIMEED